jgi:hypothetical protein
MLKTLKEWDKIMESIMQCRNCKEFSECGFVWKCKQDLNWNDFKSQVCGNETCIDFEQRDNALSI